MSSLAIVNAASVNRVVALAADGQCAVVTDTARGVVHIAGGATLGDATAVEAAAVLARSIWLVARAPGGHVLRRYDLSGRPLAEPVALGELGAHVPISATRTGTVTALIGSERLALARETGEAIAVESIEPRRGRCVLLGSRIAERRGKAIEVSGSRVAFALPLDLSVGTLGAGALVLDGAAALFEVRVSGRGTALMYDVQTGALRTRIRLGEAQVLAIAERSGIAVLGGGPHIALLDLRAGRCVGERSLTAPVVAAAIDASGERVMCVDESGALVELGACSTAVEMLVSADQVDADAETTAAQLERIEPIEPIERIEPIEPTEPTEPTEPIEPIARVPAATPPACYASELAGLGGPRRPTIDGLVLDAYLAAMRRWVVASCRAAVATAGARDAYDDVSFAMPGPQPPSEAATTAMAAARDALDVFSTWADGAPHVELARALGLSPLATRILVLVAAPQIWGELARVYGRCTADPARPLVDELLLAHLLHADSRQRAALGRELDEDAPLVRTGAVALARGLRPYAAVAVHPAIARRLAGAPPAGDIEHPPTPLPLADIVAPHGALEALARDLASAAPHRCRVVLRGRAGAGRRTIAAALAASVGRQIGAVPASSTDADVVRARLREVALRGDIPCVTLERGIDDPAAQARLRAVLDDHVGPLFIRAPHTGELPLAAGYLALELPPLTETARCDAWRTALSRHGHDATFASALALRFAATPGTMQRVCASVASCESVDVLSHAFRQHRSSTIEACAARVERLPAWDQLVVPADVEDALREVLARARHRRIVLDEWGMDRVAATARGITALFQGGPGTGKTLAAGAIARALGFELWRVDLSKVASKWIGETEKNLSAVFDAAEDGDVVLLFDEADSLFGRRTEVRTSQDRSANAETNYLLQRLDAFTGIAILTTNFGTAIDPAFRRRLSVHVQFPFPDETDRARLWRAHVPATLPTAGDLELGALARRFELSGGYIRNAALRAAYLAAADGSPLSADHLRRAVALEYQRAGKIGEGRLE